jgi:hypothetical protein
MKRARRGLQHGSLLTAAALSLSLVASSAYATDLCHNIGGPNGLGANTDCPLTTPAPGCVVPLEGSASIIVPPGSFLGILLGGPQFHPPFDFNNLPPAVLAHIAHGDGFATDFFDLHLASEIGPHQASNVDCMAVRIIPQPEEPGN